MKHIKFNCEYNYFEGRDALGGKWSKAIKASSAREAYEKFIRSVGVYQSAVSVTWGFMGSETFWDHVDKASNSNAEGKAEGEQIESQETKKLEDLDIEYQESGWASFLNFCGSLNLILFVIGGIWLFNAGSNDQFMAMNLMIIGLVAGINSFFFAFLVNTFTRIQHNTHLTTLELIKLNKKNDSDN